MRTSEIEKRPVVTFAGEDVAQVKDVVYASGGGAVAGFTLAGRGLFAGPKKESLPWQSVEALGADAVMVRDESVLVPTQAVLEASGATGGSGGNILGSRVLTDAGTELGTVIDVVVAVGDGSRECDVVGYEIEASELMQSHGKTMLVPLPDTLSASAEYLMVPATTVDFVSHDLAGFGASVTAFRTRLEEGGQATDGPEAAPSAPPTPAFAAAPPAPAVQAAQPAQPASPPVYRPAPPPESAEPAEPPEPPQPPRVESMGLSAAAEVAEVEPQTASQAASRVPSEPAPTEPAPAVPTMGLVDAAEEERG